MELLFEVQKRSNESWDMDRAHFHGEYEVLFPLTGSGDIFIDNASYPLCPGYLFVVDAATPHRSRSTPTKDYSRYVLHFPRDSLDALGVFSTDDLLAERGFCARLDADSMRICNEIFEELILPGDTLAHSLRRNAAFIRLIALIVEKWTQLPNMPPRYAEDSVIASVINHIRTNLTHNHTLDELAARFFVSKSALCHRFKAETGFSVLEYIIHCRVQHARTLLMHGSAVREAGEAAGFGDNANFIRTFHKLTGMTPGAYAKSIRRNT